MAYANIQKNGNLSQREQLDTLEQAAAFNPRDGEMVNDLATNQCDSKRKRRKDS